MIQTISDTNVKLGILCLLYYIIILICLLFLLYYCKTNGLVTLHENGTTPGTGTAWYAVEMFTLVGTGT